MKLFNLILLFFFIVVFQMVAQEVYITPTKEFEPNQKVYLFGNDVKLREEPNTSSKVISLLKISTEVFVIEKTNKIKLYNGIDWPWYKIKTSNGEEGFLLGGLISKDIKKIKNSIYLISLRKVNDDYFVLTRVVNGNQDYLENSKKIATTTFSISVSDNKGVKSIKNMIYIDYLAEACGVDGGGYYLFNTGNSLIKAIELSSVADGGLYWLKEDVVFPSDFGGKKDKIILKREHGEMIDEVTEHKKITIETKQFVWQGKELAIDTNKK